MTNLTDCRFCSEISQKNGEDPIGTAGNYDQWLILELKQPWLPTMWVEDPRVVPLVNLMKKLILWRNVKIRALAIAPDPNDSIVGSARLFYYHRPARSFSEFDKQEFLVPESQLIPVATALLKNDGREFKKFEQYKQNSRDTREILVCTHANVDVACGRFGYPIYQQLRTQYAQEGKLRVWRCSHLGGHRFAPTLIDFPSGRFWGHLDPNILDTLINQQGSVTSLRPFYRGWSGLTPLAQIAEREMWLEEGWDWLNFLKSGQIVDLQGVGIAKYFYLILQQIPLQPIQILLNRWIGQRITQAKICLTFQRKDKTKKEVYEAIIQKIQPVPSAKYSGEKMQIEPVAQYKVTKLSKVI